jgi:hypothetical protein
LFQPRPISASVYSKPPTISMRARCLCAGDRIEDRLAAAFGHAGHEQARPSAGDVDLELYGGEDRLVQFLERGGEHVEDRRAGLGILPGEDAQQRRTLRLARTLVDHHCRLALTLVDWAGPAEDSHEREPVELGRAVLALIDLEAADRLTMSVRRQSVELTGAAVGAVAVDELAPLDAPFGVRHRRLLPACLASLRRALIHQNPINRPRPSKAARTMRRTPQHARAGPACRRPGPSSAGRSSRYATTAAT